MVYGGFGFWGGLGFGGLGFGHPPRTLKAKAKDKNLRSIEFRV